MSSLLWQLWDRLVLFLANLNPATKAKVEALNERVKAAEAKEREAEEQERLSRTAYAASEQRRQQLEQNLAESKRLQAVDQQLLVESEARRKVLRDDLGKAEADIDSRSDDDLIFSGVPEPNNPPKAG